MALLTSSAFVSQILGGKQGRSPLYFLFGPETQRLNDAATKLKDLFISQAGGEENYFRYNRLGSGADETTASEVAAQLNTVSMFGGGKVVWVGTLESPPKKDDAEALSAYAKNPNPQCTLIVTVSSHGWEKKTAEGFDKSPLATAFSEKGVAVKFAPLRGDDLAKWAQSRFRERSCQIGMEAAQKLVELADNDMDRLTGEIEKVSLYAGEGNDVTLAMVEELVGDHRSKSVWDFLALFRRRNLAGSILALDSLMAQNEPSQMILKVLTGEIMKIGAAQEFKRRRGSFESYAEALGQPSFKLKDIWADADKWSSKDVKTALRATLEASMSQMKAGVNPAVALTAMIMTALAGNPAVKPGGQNSYPVTRP
ncbi:MAG: DNA polymerase III subunit delta [Nitrospinae bacterium]|nr:DNA polymerase III subunit delta [Nitrospinota bacterium]MBF0633163.1 DNA polymerase III subunit delta [Nitrospinota bacterium]